MPLDPDMATLLRALEALPAFESGTAAQARALYRSSTVGRRDATTLAPVGSIENLLLTAELAARVFRPRADGPLPTVVYFHGGGYVIGDPETHESGARRLCADLPAVVVSVDYRLAPEHPFPAAPDDAFTALLCVRDRISEFGGDTTRLAVAGDSAGATLATVCAQRADADGVELAGQLLAYPSTDPAGHYRSRVDNGQGYYLTETLLQWLFGQYLHTEWRHVPGSAIAADPRFAPLRAADLSGLAPAVIATAEFDPLRDEGNAYAEALRAAGVPVAHREFPGLIHGFYGFGSGSAAADQAITWINNQFALLLTDGRR